MAEIRFKATRRLDGSYRVITKEGDLKYDDNPDSRDGIWLRLTSHNRILIDCSRDGTFRIVFPDGDFIKEES